jgi:SH3-like domain-containing protein
MHLPCQITRPVTRLLFALSLSLVILPLSAMAADYVAVTKDGANIRSGPDPKKDLLWEVFKDFPLQVVKRQKEWLQIKDFEGDQGWIFANLVSKEKRVIVKATTANMRNEPKKDAPVVATVKYGVVFTPVEKKGEWLKVKHEDGTSGWIASALLWPPDIL